ncbi:MAG: aromatic ring-hydroxylating dioxygenase subunit alpha, partial [Pseudomonadota bacterium]
MTSNVTSSPLDCTGHPATLNASAYTDADIFARESKLIFRKHWWLVAPEAQLRERGACVGSRVARWPIVLMRGEDDVLRGFHNVCRHRAGPLMDDGECTVLKQGIACRYHAWRYNLDGSLRHAPGLKSGVDLEFESLGLFAIKVACWNGLVFASLDDDPPHLEDWLGDIVYIAQDFPRIDELEFDDHIENIGQANWKAYGDNSCEGYHVGMVHKALGKSVGRDS